MKVLTTLVFGLGLWLVATASEDRAQQSTTTPEVPFEWRGKVTDAAKLSIEQNEWGTLQWTCNGKLMPGADQTVGLATIFPGKKNPVHYHPNCEEVLYVISGEGLQSFDGRTVRLRAGMTIRIPANVRHNLLNTGRGPLQTLVSFSSGDRKTVWVKATPSKF